MRNDSQPPGIDSTTESDRHPFTNATRKQRTYFPRKIWQTSKTGPGGLDDGDRDAIRSWTKLNQKWRYESMTQYSAESYVRERFADRPEILEIFTDLQDPILRADMIRYLILLGDGGLYTDLDTKSLKPIEDWVPPEYQEDTNVVVGIEYDRLTDFRWNDWTLDLQFSTWALLAKPHHPLLEYTVQKVIRGLKTLALKQERTISGVKASREEVLDTTGPALFTRSVFEVLSQSTGTNFTWTNVTNLKEPRLVDDILILPITAFGCGQWHSNAGNPEEETAMVQHLFKGSWKVDHPVDEKPEEEEHKDKEHKEEEANESLEEVSLEVHAEQSSTAHQKQFSEADSERQPQDLQEDKNKDVGKELGDRRKGALTVDRSYNLDGEGGQEVQDDQSAQLNPHESQALHRMKQLSHKGHERDE
ncbi:MAG: hypothetical protein LQ340_003356 [Diploschistes diacapsis]|nr:MAG: hypothetical protein LQ340_003356 [Diploschistes diacapsis]